MRKYADCFFLSDVIREFGRLDKKLRSIKL